MRILVKTSRWAVAIGLTAVVAGGALAYANQDDSSDDLVAVGTSHYQPDPLLRTARGTIEFEATVTDNEECPIEPAALVRDSGDDPVELWVGDVTMRVSGGFCPAGGVIRTERFVVALPPRLRDRDIVVSPDLEVDVEDDWLVVPDGYTQIAMTMCSEICELTTQSDTELSSDLIDLAAVLGCDRLDEGVGYQFEGRAQSYDCSEDGDAIAVLHSYTPDRVADVERYLSIRTDSDQLNSCPDGSSPPGPWILVAPTWAASSYDEHRIRLAADQLGGDYVGGGATPDDPPIGPPPSYMIPGACDQG